MKCLQWPTALLLLACVEKATSNYNANRSSKPIIIDTDIFSDVDDVGALAIANILHNCGLADIQAVMINTNSRYGAVAASTINTYFNNPSIPIAALRPLTDDTFLDTWTWTLSEFASKLAHNFAHALPSAAAAREPVGTYLSLLAAAPDDRSLTIVSLGHVTNLYDLLHVPAAHALIERKVRELVVMGGEYPRGKEYNFSVNVTVSLVSGPQEAPADTSFGAFSPAASASVPAAVPPQTLGDTTENAAAYVLAHWPATVPVTFLGAELGSKVISGAGLRQHALATSPVRAAYEWYVGRCQTARESWDPLTVMYAVLGLSGLFRDSEGKESMFRFGNEAGYNLVSPRDGSNAWVDDPTVRNQHWLELADGVNKEEIEWMLTRLFAWDPDVAGCDSGLDISENEFRVQ